MLGKFLLLVLLFCLIESQNGYKLTQPVSNYVKELISFTDPSKDPCNNFYDYACGNWKINEKYRSTRQKQSNMMNMNYLTYNMIHSILENDKDLNQSAYEYKEELRVMQNIYNVCVNESDLEMVGKSDSYLRLLNNIGGFPAVNSTWNSTEFDWVTMASEISAYGVDAFFTEIILPVYPFPPYLTKMKLEFNVYVNKINLQNDEDDVWKLNKGAMKRLLELYGVDNEKSDEIVLNILNFLKKMAQLNVDTEGLTEEEKKEFLPADVDDDKQYFNEIIQKYVNISWNNDELDYLTVLENTNLLSRSIFSKMYRVINETDQETIANYLALRLLYLLHGDYNMMVKGRTHYCSKYLLLNLPMHVSYYYSQHFNPTEDQKLEIKKIVGEIMKSLNKVINEAEWIDSQTKSEANEKIKMMQTHIGQVNDPIYEVIMKEILKVNFTDDFQENNIITKKLSKHLQRYQFKNIDLVNETSKPFELLNTAQINGFYFLIDNAIYLTAGLLHAPVFDLNFSNSIKYGTIGYVVGHELFHAFDPNGRLFDATGRERNWWSNSSEIYYKNQSKCFKAQYDKYYIQEIKTYQNGKKIMDESMADIIGLQLAFDSHLRNFDNNIPDTNEEFHLTNNQTFFLAFSQLYCSHYDIEKLWNETDDEHPVDYYRVIGALQNFEEFSRAYDCSVGSNMNPIKKCNIFQ